MNTQLIKAWLKANPRAAFALYGFILALIMCLFFSTCSHAQPVPRACGQYQRQVAREVSARLGPNSTAAPFGAQMMQESSCNAAARSSVGALGLTQFMPETAQWIGSMDSALTPAQPMNPNWAIKAMVLYDSWLMNRDTGASECDTYAFALSSYNGGEGWLRRDIAYTRAKGLPGDVWYGSVETHPDPRRSRAAIAENRNYPRRILLVLQPRFVVANWGREVHCPVSPP